MKRRGWRVALTVATLGLGLVAGLVALNWATVRDHVEAWWFQATTSTRTLTPQKLPPTTESVPVNLTPEYLIQCLASYSGHTVVFDPESLQGTRFYYKGHSLPLRRPIAFTHLRVYVHWIAASPPKVMLGMLEEKWRLRVLEQRFPRRAYVVVGYPCLDEWIEIGDPVCQCKCADCWARYY